MLESLFKEPVLQTKNGRMASALTAKLKANNISFTVKLDDLNHRGGLNDTTTLQPHTKSMPVTTVYVFKKDLTKAQSLLNMLQKDERDIEQ